MEAETKVKLRSLEPYRHLFPKARVVDLTVERRAGVSHTVKFIPQVVKNCTWMVERYVNQELKGLSTFDACKKLWHFVKYHIEYTPDEELKEQVRSPRRLIHDAKGDCDCMTTFIACCLYKLGVRGIINRITEYEHRGRFQHIYPLVPDGKGGYIIMDCVVEKFNYEKPYTKKEDYNMELQFLDGIDDEQEPVGGIYDTHIYDNRAAMAELGRIFKRAAAKKSAPAPAAKKPLLKKPLLKKPILNKPIVKKPLINKPLLKKPILPQRSPAKKQAAQAKRKVIAKKSLKVVNKVNKINPATVLLRAGILASMKLNVLKIAERLKWAYASPELARSKGMDMSKYEQLKSVLKKTERIFFAAGGKPENLKHAILTGNGNKNHEVAGIRDFEQNTALSQLLGSIYADEFINGMEGFRGFDGLEGYEELHGLGEPATASSVAAASTAMGTLAALLKSIGELFPNKNKKVEAPTAESKGLLVPKIQPKTEVSIYEEGQSEAAPIEENYTEQSSEEELEPSAEEFSENPSEENFEPEEQTEDYHSEVASEQISEEEEYPNEQVVEEYSDEQPVQEEMSGILSGLNGGTISAFYQEHKKWVLPVGLGLGGLALYLIADHFMGEKPKPIATSGGYPVDGIGKKRRGRKIGSRNKTKKEKLSVIELM